MYTSSVQIRVARPLNEVFPFIEDARNRPQWDDSVESEELTSPEPIGVGTTVRTRMRSMGRELEYDWEVVEHRPPHRMTIESSSGPFPTTLRGGWTTTTARRASTSRSPDGPRGRCGWSSR